MKKIHPSWLTLGFLWAVSSVFAQNTNIVLRSSMQFPGQTLANVCGYAANGREYALLGGSKGLIILDVTNPDVPVQIKQIPGPDNLWKEIKVYKQYAYVTTEGGEGLQIVDLGNLPNDNLPFHHYEGNGAINGQLSTIHALHIDVTKGFLYLWGSNLFEGGAVVCDLNADPYNPVYVGKFDQLGYIHDGYVDNDTMYASHIFDGIFSVVNMANKSNPVLLGTHETPNKFTHNTWLSENRKTLFTTDEVDNSFLAAYDVSDPSDIQFLDKIQSNPGSGSVVHNTHIRGNYAITSWYQDGITVVDVTQPDNLVQVGNFDTWPGMGGGFQGCWGVFPFLPSGTLIATNIPNTDGGAGEVFILTPEFKRACYLTGLVSNSTTGNPITNVQITLIGGNISELNQLNGTFNVGQAQAGTFNLEFKKVGYATKIVPVTLVPGETTVVNVQLDELNTYTINGIVLREGTANPVPNARISLFNSAISFEGTANTDGQFSIPNVFAGNYQVIAGAWGYEYKVIENQNINATKTFAIELGKGYADDFVFDYGWQASGTSATGVWERAVPVSITPSGFYSPNNDFDQDLGNTCLITGNGAAMPAFDDVEAGTSVLTSPIMDLSGYDDPYVQGAIWCVSVSISQEFQDSIWVYISNGQEEKLLASFKGDQTGWRTLNQRIKSVLPLTNTMQLKIVCYDDPGYSEPDSYEAAFDHFKITEGTVAADDLPDEITVKIQSNPFHQNAVLDYRFPSDGGILNLFDITGHLRERVVLNGGSGLSTFGETLETGIYVLQILHAGKIVRTTKLVKIK